MGTWGAGNFDDDTAADHLSIVTGKLVEEIEAAMADAKTIEPDEYWGVAVPCNLELLHLIAKRGYVGCMLPPASTLSEWKTAYMRVWEGYIDQLEPAPDFKKQRKRVLLQTFNNLIRLARKEEATQ